MKFKSLTPLMLYVVVQAAVLFFAAGLATVEQFRLGHRYPNSTMPYIGDLFDVAGLLAFVSLLSHFALQYRLPWKNRVITTLALIVLYLSSYSLLSFCGKYHASRSGTNRWNAVGLAVVDQDLWHARGVFWQPFVTIDGKHTYQATYLGFFYSPLICVDRMYVHKTVKLFNTP